MGGSMCRECDGAWRGAARALVDLMEERGFQSVIMGHGAVVVWNSAAEPDYYPETPDGPGELRGPALWQEVRTGRRADGGLWWFWVWPGAYGEPPELEPLCPAEDVVTAADRLAKVLAVPFAEASPGAS
ncbi:hypothetical protein [Actinomadura litoris]|uniref:Uncharacterized protein n=1 Tax=Actinomadura litoris TaxID=2678616 RepID=A0A7K1L9Z5_9ACTN|nr:hypothetical protein [Actinomadura litoris]MUN41251.1 hypothetical protein [Actinomadura litoris]